MADTTLADAVAPGGWHAERLAELRTELRQCGVDGCFVPRADVHQGEYVAARDERLAWITGFTGSAGAAIVLAERAAVFVDGRYTVQVRQQVDAAYFEFRHLIDEPPAAWLAAHAAGLRIGVDPWLVPPALFERLDATLRASGGELVALATNPIDAVWHDQPDAPLGAIEPHPLACAGRAAADKRRALATTVAARGALALVETQPDNIAWLLNVRGADVPYNPVPQSFLLLYADGAAEWFVDARKLPAEAERAGWELDGVRIAPVETFAARLATGFEAGARVWLDPDAAPAAARFALEAAGCQPLLAASPVTLAKAPKNPVELAGIRAAHVRDGVALVRLLAWLDRSVAAGQVLDERDVVEQVLACRREQAQFREPSFATIAAAGANAALPHYRVDPAAPAPLLPQGVFLVDSGGQYRDGTTDCTRTVALGPLDAEPRDRYTRVLKGHIALATARFPRGTRGYHLDALARQFLWAVGCDYDHGTGHGVGQFLSVHEPPQRISKAAVAVDLEPGMVLSNEPGYYAAGRYGMRIENLVEVVEHADGYLGFRELSLVPIDRRPLDLDQLTAAERAWLDAYHARVRAEVLPGVRALSAADAEWLEAATAPL